MARKTRLDTGTSSTVSSNQQGLHEHLHSTVQKHLDHAWRKPINKFSIDVFKQIEDWLMSGDQPLILDSGCGTGDSSFNLARKFPEARVLGFDRSEIRLDKLERKHQLPKNCLVVRADADDLWRQLVTMQIKPTRHYLFFPNPYPKAAQLNRRWHGSPVFPYLLKLGGEIELRSNWKTYLDEFSEAVLLASKVPSHIEQYSPDRAFSAFETKYQSSGQSLWRLRCDLSNNAL